MNRMIVHNHGIDPSCRESRLSDGSLRGECMKPLRLRDRRLEPGRGRVYLKSVGLWYADYRYPSGLLVCSWARDASEAADWIRTKAEEATK